MKDSSWSVGKGYSCLREETPHGFDIAIEGDVVTRHGNVWATSFVSSGDKHELTRMDFVFSGRCYSRTFDKFFTKRGLATKAKKFAEEVVKTAPKPRKDYYDCILQGEEACGRVYST